MLCPYRIYQDLTTSQLVFDIESHDMYETRHILEWCWLDQRRGVTFLNISVAGRANSVVHSMSIVMTSTVC